MTLLHAIIGRASHRTNEPLRTARLTLVAAGVLMAISVTAGTRAETYTWVGPDIGDWHDADNWAPPGVPSSREDVVLIPDAGVTVQVWGSYFIGEVMCDGEIAILGFQGLTLYNESTIARLTLDACLTCGITAEEQLTVTERCNWYKGGFIGTVTFAETAEVYLDTSSSKGIANLTLTNNGAMYWLDGPIGPTQVLFVNNGLFDIQVAGYHIDNPQGGAGYLVNYGTLRKSSAGLTDSELLLQNHGAIELLGGTLAANLTQYDGSTELAGGSLQCSCAMVLEGGELRGSGDIAAAVSNEGGVVSPGGVDFGQLSIAFDYTQSADAVLAIDVDGTGNLVEHDVLQIDGTASLNGTLSASVSGSEPCDMFPFLNAASIRGDFSDVLAGPLQPSYQDSGIALVHPALDCPADVTRDNIVDVADLVAIVLDWGPCAGQPCNADVNGDGDVDVCDLIEVILNWGPCC